MGNKQARPPSSSSIKLQESNPGASTGAHTEASTCSSSSSLSHNTKLPYTEASMAPYIGASIGPSSSESFSLNNNERPFALAHSEPCIEPITKDEAFTVMDPADIRYSRTSFGRSFTPSFLKTHFNPAVPSMSYSEVFKAARPDLLLESLLSKLRTGHITVDSIEPIRVFFYKASWYSLDNRRLWVFKQFGQPIPVHITTSLDDFLHVFQEDGDNRTATFFPEERNAHDSSEARTKNIHAQKNDLLDHVFQWSTCDIMDDKLLKSKVTMIPEQFGSLNEYFTSFKWPLVEEVRAQLKQSLELIEEAPYAPIVQVQEDAIREMSSTVEPLKKYKDLTIYIDQEHLKKCAQKNGVEFKFRPKDLILLSTNLPASMEELIRCSRELHLMASVKKIEEEDEECVEPLPLKIIVHKGRCNAVHQELMEKGRTWYAIYLLGLATSSRIWRALHPAPEESNLSIIREILKYRPDQETLKQDDTPSSQLSKQIVAKYCSSFKLNKSQTNAVVEVLCDLQNRVDQGVRMIQGPPGTGKTSTIVTLVSVAASIRMKCLVACPTNTAIAEVALRYMKRLQSPDSLQFGEFCESTSCSNMDSNLAFKHLCIRDLILIGNEVKLPLQGPLKQIYLPKRVKRIQTAYKSWRETVFDLSDFIVSIKLHYQQTRQGVNSAQHKTLSEFARRNLKELIEQLGKHGNTLVQELPIASDVVFSETVQLAEKLLNSVLDSSVSEEAFSNWFDTNQSRLNLVDQLQECLKQNSGPFSIRESIEDLCIKGSSLVFCTVSTAGSYNVKVAAPFQCLIIDEAAQLMEAETAIATCLPGLNHAILVGDHHQLPATVISKVASDSAFGRSLFERMISLGHPCHLLNTQYRMHPAISFFPNSQFYGGCLLNGENVRSPAYEIHEQLLYGSYAFIDVNEGAEQMGDDGKSKRNIVEASVIVALVRILREAIMKTNTPSLTVGIITPYSSQKDHLKKCFEKQKHEPLIVDINSVDGFQGQEKDIIILSTVRANKHGAIGFLKDYRRLNVAVTRARYCLWIVGSRRTLSAEHNIWTLLLKDAANRKLCTRAGAEPKLAKAVIKAKKDLDEYFDLIEMGSSLFTNMLWKVFFSNDFKQSLLQIKSFEKRQKIVYKIRYLASGYHSTRTEVRNMASMDRTKGLIVVHRTADLYLVWSIDIERDERVKQMIKIWNLVSFENLSKFIKRLEAAFDVYSVEYIERCKMRCLSRDDKLTVPATWEEDTDFVWFKPHVGVADPQSHEQVFETSSVNESLLLMKFYAMSSGIAENLLTAEDGSEMNLPFEVNKEESIIIRHPSSCFILGRSGTGKTTVLVTKLLQREQQYQISLHGVDSSELPQETSGVANKEHIKQILITLSPLLCSSIKQQITQIQRTLSATADSTSADVSSNSDYELFLDDDDENRIMGFLPNTFVEMPEKYYPMVITFRRFLMMLNNSIPCPFSGDSTRSSIHKKEIDFDQFDSDFWPHLNFNFTRKFDSCTVFAEIMSVIKGSIQAVKDPEGVLSKESYLSSVNGKLLNIQQREDIYNLFLQYEKMKIKTHGYDMADYVRHVYKQLACGKYQGDKIDFVYIDEVQDFTQAQISLFSFVCNNSKEGYFFAGDTAQTIARGVNFRFQEVRSLFYTDFKDSSHASECGVETAADNTSKEFTPEFFQLKHNFRTHVGVVNMANSIVQLLYHFFPQSIDKLYPETSLVWGQLPVSLKAHGQDLVKSIFGSTGDPDEQVHGLGAQQVILVRDETQKAQLVQRIGKKGLVLTINGCKGLEFQDVLVYNFFSGSLMENKWRVIYEYMHQNDLMTTDNTTKKSYPTFDANKHNLLCSELKHLYVAVTRARQRLWIYEENADLLKPMLDYWVCQELIETKCLDESFISSMASNSTPDDWRKRGFEVFNQQHYDMAVLCFERAGDDHHAKLAKAANLQQVGEKQISRNKPIAINNLKEAAELFLTLERAEMAAKCHIKIGDLQSAGVIYRDNCKPPRFQDAGDCFFEAKSWVEAAKAYFEGNCVKKCLSACLLGKKFEKGLLFIRQWREGPEPENIEMAKSVEEDRDEYLQECAALSYKQHNIPTMMMFVDAFSTIDLKRNFLKGRDCIDELLNIEEAEQNYFQAAELAELKGDFLHVAELLEKAGDYDNAVKKVLLLIRNNVLWGAQNKGWPFRKNEKPVELLWKVQELAALAKSSVCCEAELEAQLMFEEMKSSQEWKGLPTEVQTSSNTAIKLFTAWKSIDTSLSILKDFDHAVGHKLGPVTKFHDKNTLLVNILRMWTEWRDIVLHCRQGLPGNDQDNVIREFCYDFFGVTHSEDSKSCLVHDPTAYWFKGYRKGRSPMKIPVQVFATLAAQFWDEQLSDTDQRMTTSLIMHFSTQCGLLKSFNCISVEERTNPLLDLTEIADQLTAHIQYSKELEVLTYNLQSQLLILLWPRYRCAREVCNIQKLREATRVVTALDKVADKLASNHKEPCTLETTARMQLIFPFLSEAWITKNASSFLETIEFWKNDAMWSNKFLHRKSELSVRNYVVEFGEQLVMIFDLDWKSIREYISPLVFVSLLEKTTVMACACDTQLHELLLPLTLAVDFMCGQGQESLCQKILQSKEQNNEKLDQLIERIVMIIFQLLWEPINIVDWFKHVRANQKTDLPPMVSRLFTVLFIICLNSRKQKLKESVVTELQKIFKYNLPIQQHLQQSYKVECGRACRVISETKAGIDQSMKHLQHVFAKTLSSMGDTLLMTRCENQSHWKPQDSVTIIELDCETDIFMKLATVAGHGSLRTCFETDGTGNGARTVTFPAQDHARKGRELYNAYLGSEARSLMVSIEAFLDELDHAIAILKCAKDDHADLLAELNKAKEELQHQSHQLDPSHEKHTSNDLEWLKARVNEVQSLLNEKRQNFESLLSYLLAARNDDNADNTQKEVMVESGKTGNTDNQADSSKADDDGDDDDDESQDKEMLGNNRKASNVNQAASSKSKRNNSRKKQRRKR